MKSSSSRVMRFLEIKISHGTGAKTREAWDLPAMLRTAAGNGFYQRAVRDGAKKVVRIKHCEFFEENGRPYAAVLFVMADAGYIDASYENMQTGAARTFAKDDGEGYRTEAHLVIDLSYTLQGTTQVYPCALEESPGLGPSVVLSRLNHPLHKAGERELKEGNDTHNWFPVVSLDGLLSRSLIEEIEKGELMSFDLVKEELQDQGLDEPEELVRRRQILCLDVRQDPEEGRVSAVIARARQIAFGENYEQVRIHYKEEGTGKHKQAVLDVPEDAVDPGEELEKLVSRSCKIELPEAMNWDHTEVVMTFAKQMATKLAEEKGD